jgi:hypothetical protein
MLASFLAVDWLLATGRPPTSGRSDRMPFGNLVHTVFGWLGRGAQAEAVLRRYWRLQRQGARGATAADGKPGSGHPE